jgi:hypothetical protein
MTKEALFYGEAFTHARYFIRGFLSGRVNLPEGVSIRVNLVANVAYEPV